MSFPPLRLLVFLGLVAFIGGTSIRAQSQMEMNATAADEAEKADKALNVAYRKLRDSLKDDPQSQKLLKDAQLAWLAFRDKEAEYEAAGDLGGSIHPMAVSTVVKRLTEERTRYLEKLLKDGPDIP